MTVGTQKIYADMVGRAMDQQGTLFFIVGENDPVTGDRQRVWTVWADGRASAVETVALYNQWVARSRDTQYIAPHEQGEMG
jgi:hypothetical protein